MSLHISLSLSLSPSLHIYIYIYDISLSLSLYIYIYIYIYDISLSLSLYIYIYIYTHTHMYIRPSGRPAGGSLRRRWTHADDLAVQPSAWCGFDDDRFARQIFDLRRPPVRLGKWKHDDLAAGLRHLYICIYVCMYVWMNEVCMYVYIYIYMYIHIHVHIVYTCMNIDAGRQNCSTFRGKQLDCAGQLPTSGRVSAGEWRACTARLLEFVVEHLAVLWKVAKP